MLKLSIKKRDCLKSEEFQHRGTEVLSYTEKVKLEINTLCNSVSPYLCVENTFEKASSKNELQKKSLKQFILRRFYIIQQDINCGLASMMCPA